MTEQDVWLQSASCPFFFYCSTSLKYTYREISFRSIEALLYILLRPLLYMWDSRSLYFKSKKILMWFNQTIYPHMTEPHEVQPGLSVEADGERSSERLSLAPCMSEVRGWPWLNLNWGSTIRNTPFSVCLPVYICLFLSLSITHTHSHTQTASLLRILAFGVTAGDNTHSSTLSLHQKEKKAICKTLTEATEALAKPLQAGD